MMKEIHHANIVVSREDSRDFVFSILEKDLDFKIQGNPDFLLLEGESFGIDDARSLERWILGKPFRSDIKASLIIAKSITHEAQNALLKSLEEPPKGTYIFINIESLGGILSTFLSRVRVLDIQQEDVENKDAKKFLSEGIKGKLAIIRNLAKSEDKTPMRDLIKSLEETAYKNHSKNMKDILTAKIFAGSRGSSPKMLLEWLSCVL